MQIFISYRRDDSAVAARLLYNELVHRFGVKAVFLDVDDIGYGDDFAQRIDERLALADVVLIVIGTRWHQIIEQRLRGDDWVRHEVAQALALREAGLQANPRPPARAGRPRVLPLQLDDTDWPGAALPADIAPLQRLSALKLHKASLKLHLNEVMQAVQGYTFEEKSQQLITDQRVGWRSRAAALGLGLVLFLAAWLALFDLLALDTQLANVGIAFAGGSATSGGAATVGVAGAASGAATTAAGVTLVRIDEATVQAVGRPFGPSWRAEHARLIDQVAAAGARVLAFDVVMPEPAAEAAADAALQRSLSAVRGRLPVILGVQGVQGLAGDEPAIAPALAPLVHWGVACAGNRLGRAMLMPLAVQRRAAPQGVAPGMAPGMSSWWPSLALAAFSAGGKVEALDWLGQRLQVRDEVQQRSPWVDFFSAETIAARQNCAALGVGDRVASQWIDPAAVAAVAAAGAALPRVAYERVLNGVPQALALLRGRTVIVGVMLRHEDSFRLPLAAGAEPWGSELIAAQVEAMLQQRVMRALGPLGQWLWMTLLALAGVALALWLRQRSAWQRRGALALAALAVCAAALIWLRLEQQWLAPQHGVVALLLGAWMASALSRRGQRGEKR